MVTYNDYDVFYDYEVLDNVTTNAMLYPGSRQIVIPYSVHIDTIQPDTPKIEVTQKDEKEILQYVIDENRSSLERWNIPEDRVTLTSNFMQEVIKMDSTIPQNRGTMFGFNSSGYDVAISAYLLDQAKKQRYSNVDPKEIIVDAASVREFSNYLFDHPSRSPWGSVRDRANETRNFELFQKFASLMNSDWNIDVQSLNAKMSKSALKRLAAQGGFKIETSDKLKDGVSTIESVEDLAELLAYNVNDIFATMWLFEQEPYQTPYNQRLTLIERYGDNQFKGRNIKRDSTEAKLIENVISPNDSLVDDPEISLAYPITRGYLPEEEKEKLDDEFGLEKANEMYDALEQAAKVMTPEEYKNNKELAMNKFLNQQYIGKKDTEPDHMIVKYFFYDTNHPKIVAQGGKFVYAVNTYEGFNAWMIHNMDIWATHRNITSHGIDSLLEDLMDYNTSDLQWDIHANKIIKDIGEHKENSLYSWFYFNDEHQKVVAKDKRLMMDLLEYMENRYDMDPQIYEYYKAYRGQDMGHQDSVANVKETLPPHLKTGAAVLVAPGVPVFATMSIGGIHGNLIDLYRYEQDLAEAESFNGKRQDVIDFYMEKAEQFSVEGYLSITGETTAGEKEKIYSLAKHTVEELAPVLARRTKRNGYVLGEPEEIQEAVPYDYTTGSYTKAKFRTPKRTRKMNDYTTTFYDFDVIHMDIASYYPTLISILKTLQTKDGNDLYKGLLEERVKLKNSLPWDKATWDEQDHLNEAMQVANKLLLNAASGAADASYDNNIRVNNKAYRMRISGQLILFALCLDIIAQGGIPNSINTDGVYVHDMDVDTADGIIQKWASKFMLEADTEFIDLFISKDSNNRIEYYKSDRGETILASGGTVGNWRGTSLTGNLNRPPIVDRALTEYLIRYEEPLLGFDEEYIRNYITSFIEERIEKGKDDPAAHEELFNFFQMPLSSNERIHRYIVYEDKDGKWSYPSSINRIFFTKADAGDYETYKAIMVVINKTAKKDVERAVKIAYEADIVGATDYEDDKDVHIKTVRVTGIDEEQHFVIQNQSTATIDWDLTEHFDIDAYVDMVEAQWKNWAV